MPAEREVKINGVGGHQFSVKETGYPFFQVYSSPHTKTNIFSLAQVEDQYKITYAPQESFTIYLPQGGMGFKCVDGMYVADWDEYKHIFSMTACTKAAEEQAHKAYNLRKSLSSVQ